MTDPARTEEFTPEVHHALIRLEDRAERLNQCLSAQLEADYPITYERIHRLVCGVRDYLPTLREAARRG